LDEHFKGEPFSKVFPVQEEMPPRLPMLAHDETFAFT
jgi:hypothetical protein